MWTPLTLPGVQRNASSGEIGRTPRFSHDYGLEVGRRTNWRTLKKKQYFSNT